MDYELWENRHPICCVCCYSENNKYCPINIYWISFIQPHRYTFYIFCIHDIHGTCSVVRKSVIRSSRFLLLYFFQASVMRCHYLTFCNALCGTLVVVFFGYDIALCLWNYILGVAWGSWDKRDLLSFLFSEEKSQDSLCKKSGIFHNLLLSKQSQITKQKILQNTWKDAVYEAEVVQMSWKI